MGAGRGATLVSTCGLLITVVSLAAEHGLGRLPGSRADSVAAVPSRSCSVAPGILLDQGLNPCLLH